MERDPQSEVHVERIGHISVVEIDRPPLNFFDVTLVETILRRMQELDSDPQCRAIVLAAAGKVFCAGADFGGGIDPEAGLKIAEDLYGKAIGIFEIGTPIVAAVQGPAIGGGLGLALTADFRITCEEARFSANFALLGMHCGFAISKTLPRTVGQAAAARLLYTGNRINGVEAWECGLADFLVPQEELRDRAIAFASEIAKGAPIAVRDMRRTLRQGLVEEVRAALAHELSMQRNHMQTADFREGIKASSERRTPEFAGQ
ncbi:MAG: enoyl-CoA hydratase/isomerase family protein [Rhizobiaceae bacterium]